MADSASDPFPAALQVDATQDLQARGDEAARVVELLDHYLLELKAGRQPNRQQLLKDHPELAVQLEACLAGIEFIHSGQNAAHPAGKRLGDFRILREVGHGGMGAVYEAEQVSLGRRVALKVLRFGPVSDAEALQRFQREAETVARLHHTNIVPIFAVGSEGGVNYYAMQFIVGRSLDQVLRHEARPIPWRKVAEWGLQAAEALAHAHARGVIHRDVKPSNLLIDDEEGRIWLTDFGLAKRLDDVTLSMTGALLGTPRYMSPEQAAAAHQKLDHRTDLYSLGASLYELATNQPVFVGDSPHKVISQILTREPDSPRRFMPQLPRDLDTILMKCLAKEPGRRYASARELADDLRALLDGRPIAARRANVVELASRWLQRQQRNVAIGTIAAATTLGLVVAIVLGSYVWHRSRLASVMFKTDHPPLVAELLASESGEPAAPRITVPSLQRLEIPAGDYRMRLAGSNRLSHTFDLHLERGESLQRKLDLEDTLLWQDMKFERSYRLARIETRSDKPEGNAGSARTDVVQLTATGLRCAAGNTGLERWSLNLQKPEKTLLSESVRIVWPWDNHGANYVFGQGKFDGRPFVVAAQHAPAPGTFDFNSDGTSDLLVAARHQAWLLAVSGADGEPLWTLAHGEALPQKEQAPSYQGVRGAVLYPPLVVADQDGDGASDLAALFIHADATGQSCQRWIELVSGARGTSLWRHDLPGELFHLPQGEAPPYALRWFFGAGGGYSSGGAGWQSNYHYLTRTLGTAERSGYHHYAPGPLTHAADANGQAVLMLAAGSTVVALEARSGRERWPAAPVGVRSAMETRSGDFDGDGLADLLLVDPQPAKGIARPGVVTGPTPQTRLTAWSPARQAILWQQTVAAELPRQHDVQLDVPAWPVIADLEGDGVSEVLVPDESSEPLPSGSGPPWGKLALLEGRSGRPRWRRRIMNSDQQLECFLAGPDIDGDRVAEVYAATLWGRKCDLYVECMSGVDGEVLWRARQPLLPGDAEMGLYRLANLAWSDTGVDGWPQLIVPARNSEGDARDCVCLFSAGTGEMSHMAVGVTEVHPAELDGDGNADLVLLSRAARSNWDQGGVLHATRGVGREAWKRILPPQAVVGDLNGDGIRDMVSEPNYRMVNAHCGATGKRLWQFMSDHVWNTEIFPAQQLDGPRGLFPAEQDLNGDGVPDLFMTTGRMMSDSQPVMRAISGRTGKRLWDCELSGQVFRSIPLIECRDLDNDGAVEVIVAAACNYRMPAGAGVSSSDAQLWLAVVSGNDGRLRWAEALSEYNARYDFEQLHLEAGYADLNGDKVLDVVLPAQASAASLKLEMRALSGSDGKPLWNVPLLEDPNQQKHFMHVGPAATGDFDGDGQTEVAIASMGQSTDEIGPSTFVDLTVVEGSTGEPRWNWQTRVDRWSTEMHQERNLTYRLRPVVVRRHGSAGASPSHWIAMLTWGTGRQLHLFNAKGEIVSQQAEEQPPGTEAVGTRVWPLDVNGDGSDELLLHTRTGLTVIPPDALDQPVWQKSSENFSPGMRALGAVVGLLREDDAPGRLVVMGGDRDNSLHGLDPQTGRTVWTCLGNTAQVEISQYAGNHAPLNAPSRGKPAHALFRYGDVAVVRAAVAPANAKLNETWQAAMRAPARTESVADDPRLLRPLPGKPPHFDMSSTARFLMWSFFYGLTLVAVPVAYFGYLIKRRKWGLKTLLVLPAIAGLFLMGLTINGPDNDFRHPTAKLAIAAFFAGPLIFAAITLVRWSWQKRWRLLLGWSVVFVLFIFLGLASGMLSDGPLQAGESWDWNAWYWVVPPAFFALAFAMTLLVPAAWLLSFFAPYVRSTKPQLAKQPG